MTKHIAQFYFIFIFVCTYLNAQSFDCDLKLVDENIATKKLEIFEFQIKKELKINFYERKR